MQFRIRSLMVEIAFLSVFLAFWHISPVSRLFVAVQLGGMYLMNLVPRVVRLAPNSGQTPWVVRCLAYGLIVGSMLAIFFLFPDLSTTIAHWPG